MKRDCDPMLVFVITFAIVYFALEILGHLIAAHAS